MQEYGRWRLSLTCSAWRDFYDLAGCYFLGLRALPASNFQIISSAACPVPTDEPRAASLIGPLFNPQTAAEIVANLEPARCSYGTRLTRKDAAASDAPRSASMVKARVCEAYMRNTDTAVLMHGGIGFTWEHDIHLWFKTVALQRTFFGSQAYHRERLAALSSY